MVFQCRRKSFQEAPRKLRETPRQNSGKFWEILIWAHKQLFSESIGKFFSLENRAILRLLRAFSGPMGPIGTHSSRTLCSATVLFGLIGASWVKLPFAKPRLDFHDKDFTLPTEGFWAPENATEKRCLHFHCILSAPKRIQFKFLTDLKM